MGCCETVSESPPALRLEQLHNNKRMSAEQGFGPVRLTFPAGSVRIESVRKHFEKFGTITEFSPRDAFGTTEVIVKYLHLIFFEYATQKPIAHIDGVNIKVQNDDKDIEEIDEEKEQREYDEYLAMYMERVNTISTLYDELGPREHTLDSWASTTAPSANLPVQGRVDRLAWLHKPRTPPMDCRGRLLLDILSEMEKEDSLATVPSTSPAPRRRKRSSPDSAASGDAPVPREARGNKQKRHAAFPDGAAGAQDSDQD